MFLPMSTDNGGPPFAPAFVAREVGYLPATREFQVWVVAGARLKRLASLKFVRLRSRLLVASASIEIWPAIMGREKIELGWIFRPAIVNRREFELGLTFSAAAYKLVFGTRDSQRVTRHLSVVGLC